MGTNVMGLTKKINTCKNRIAAERDKLRELLSEAEDLVEDCSEAIDNIEQAVDQLSKYF